MKTSLFLKQPTGGLIQFTIMLMKPRMLTDGVGWYQNKTDVNNISENHSVQSNTDQGMKLIGHNSIFQPILTLLAGIPLALQLYGVTHTIVQINQAILLLGDTFTASTVSISLCTKGYENLWVVFQCWRRCSLSDEYEAQSQTTTSTASEAKTLASQNTLLEID